MKTLRAAVVLFLGAPLALTMFLQPPARGAGNSLSQMNHIVIIYQENWSFDGLYGRFPGADGIANAGKETAQVDKEGHPYVTLP